MGDGTGDDTYMRDSKALTAGTGKEWTEFVRPYSWLLRSEIQISACCRFHKALAAVLPRTHSANLTRVTTQEEDVWKLYMSKKNKNEDEDEDKDS